MKKKMRRLSMFLASAMIMSLLMVANIFVINVFAASVFPFTDVKSDAWYYKDVKHAYEKKLINGKTQSLYAPDENMTYAEAVKLAACMHQLKKEGSIKLKNGNPWYQSYVDYAKKHHLITEDLSWNEVATRAGYMEIFANVLTDAESKKNNVPDGSIPDVPVTHQNATAIYKLYRAGIVTGVDAKHHCDPDASIKRSEVAAILTRMTDKSKRMAIKMSSSTTADSGGSSSGGSGGSGASGSGGSGSPGGGSGSGGSGASGPGGGFSGSGMSIMTPPVKPIDPSMPMITVGELKIKTQPPANTNIYNHDFVKLFVKAQGGSGAYFYEWQAMKNDGTFETITAENFNSDGVFSGTDQHTLNLAVDSSSASARDYTLRCVIKDAKGDQVISDQAKLHFQKFMFTKQPSDATGKFDEFVTFEVATTGGKGALQYTWYYNPDGAESEKVTDLPDFSDIFRGFESSKLEFLAGPYRWVNGGSFHCEVEDANTNRLTSDQAKIIISDFRVTKHPEGVRISGSEIVKMEVEVAGGDGRYQYEWQIDKGVGPGWYWKLIEDVAEAGKVSGEKTAKLTLNVNPGDDVLNRHIRCVIKDGSGNKVESRTAVILTEDEPFVPIDPFFP